MLFRSCVIDFWRYSPECLKFLGENSGFKVLEYDWRLTVFGTQGILSCRNEPQEVRSVYVVLTKGNFVSRPQAQPFQLPTYKQMTAA